MGELRKETSFKAKILRTYFFQKVEQKERKDIHSYWGSAVQVQGHN